MRILNSPISIGQVTARNRLVLPPIATQLSDSGIVSPALLEYYAARSKHVGIVITEHSFVCRQGMARATQLSCADDSCIPGLRTLTEAIHRGGALAFAQLSHTGGFTDSSITGCPLIAPSPVLNPATTEFTSIPNEMTQEDIHGVIQAFAAAAGRARDAGYDGVEIHSAHGYLLNQFYSPLTNLRKDSYGGTRENRLRIHLEILAAVRKMVGGHYPIALRLGACDDLPGGVTAADSAAAAKILESAGLDLLDISGGMCRFTRKGHEEEGYFSTESAAVKQAVSLPVLLTGGILHTETAEQFLADGSADLIGIGRPLMKDPDYAGKLLAL